MKSYVKSAIWRIFTLLVVGIVLVVYSDKAPNWLVQSIGVLLVLPGCISLLSAFRKVNTQVEKIMFLLVGVSTIAFGIILMIWSSQFIQAFMYVVAALLIIVSCMQFFNRIDMIRKGINISKMSFLIPIITFASGIFVIIYYRDISQLPFILMGVSCVLYAILETMSILQLQRFMKEHSEFTLKEEETSKEIKDNQAVL